MSPCMTPGCITCAILPDINKIWFNTSETIQTFKHMMFMQLKQLQNTLKYAVNATCFR